MPTYANNLFPEPISKGSRGGPRWNTGVTELDSGAAELVKRWPSPRWEYDVGVGLKNLDDLDDLNAFYLAVGTDQSFAYSDIQDFNSTTSGRGTKSTTHPLDQVIGVGDGTTASFQLIKTYTFANRTHVRNIRKPLSTASTFVSVDSSVRTNSTHYTLDINTGIVTFTGGNIPANGTTIRASYDFRVPVFFGAGFDYKIAHEQVKAGRVTSIPLIEDVSQNAATPEFPWLGDGSVQSITVSQPYSYAWGRAVTFIPTASFDITLPDINEYPTGGGPVFLFVNAATVATKTLTFRNKASGAAEFALPVLKTGIVGITIDSGVKKWLACGN
jgi:uncharacterized protein (TIGR02217 family)